MILADTSVWIDHLRKGNHALAACLDEGELLMHPLVLGELACGHLPQRQQLLALWQRLPQALRATDAEVLHLIEQRRLMGRGIGYIDAHLLTSAVLSGARGVWTRDRRLADIAASLGCSAQPDDPRGNVHEPSPR